MGHSTPSTTSNGTLQMYDWRVYNSSWSMPNMKPQVQRTGMCCGVWWVFGKETTLPSDSRAESVLGSKSGHDPN